MKLIKIAKHKINSITKLSAYKVKYRKKYGPLGEQSRILNLTSPEDVAKYIRKIEGKNVEILDITEVSTPQSQQQPQPQQKQKQPQQKRKPSQRKPRNLKIIRNPNPKMPPRTGYKVVYYEDFSGSGGLKSKIYNVNSHQEAIDAFNQEFPNGVIEKGPIKLEAGPLRTDYDETGKPKDMSRGEWLQMRHMDNLPREEALKRMKQKNREKIDTGR